MLSRAVVIVSVTVALGAVVGAGTASAQGSEMCPAAPGECHGRVTQQEYNLQYEQITGRVRAAVGEVAYLQQEGPQCEQAKDSGHSARRAYTKEMGQFAFVLADQTGELRSFIRWASGLQERAHDYLKPSNQLDVRTAGHKLNLGTSQAKDGLTSMTGAAFRLAGFHCDQSEPLSKADREVTNALINVKAGFEALKRAVRNEP